MTDPIRVLIVDDHPVVRRGLRGFLETCRDLEVVGEAENGMRAVELACDLVPDVILMDLLLPGMNGVEAIDRITAVCPAAHIIVLTSYPDDEFLFPAMRAGAQGYLLKEVKPEVLVAAIRAAALGQATLHPSVAAKLVKGASGSGEEPLSELSEREVEVLRLIARGMSNKEIADTLTLAEGTVKSHVSNILSKLHLAHRTQAALYALKHKVAKLGNPDPSVKDSSR
jgi:NarL family two-component system response regulator LiaR